MPRVRLVPLRVRHVEHGHVEVDEQAWLRVRVGVGVWGWGLGLGLEVDEQAGGVDDRGHEWRGGHRWVPPEVRGVGSLSTIERRR